jgi:UDP-3-O-[3-hydroxymyristoyl] glucosamine N-acyltransferase
MDGYRKTRRVFASKQNPPQHPCQNTKTKSPYKIELKNPTAIDKNVTIGAKSVIGPYAILGKNATLEKTSI